MLENAVKAVASNASAIMADAVITGAIETGAIEAGATNTDAIRAGSTKAGAIPSPAVASNMLAQYANPLCQKMIYQPIRSRRGYDLYTRDILLSTAYAQSQQPVGV